MKYLYLFYIVFFISVGNAQVGIGTTTPTTQLDVVGDINFTTGIFYSGKTSPANLEIIRTLPTVVNNTVDIGNFNITHGAHNFRLTATVSLNQFSVSKSYIVSVSYNQTNNVWQLLNPITNTGLYVLDDFDTDINVNNSIVSIRIRRKSGIVAGNISLRIENTGFTNDIFTQTFTTGATIAPTVTFASNPVGSGNFWSTTGNPLTVDGTNFIGTTDNIPLNFRVNNAKSGRISSTGETFFGFEAGKNNSNSANDRNNSAFGYRAFFANATTTARDNTAIGQTALTANNGGSFNTALGSASLESNVVGNDNTAVGKFALKSNIASFNTAVGSEALVVNTAGTSNVAVGYKTLKTNIIGSDNTAIGFQALFTNTASNNTAIGSNSMVSNTTGTGSVAVGYQALSKNTTGTNNTAIGSNVLALCSIGGQNTAVGENALSKSTGGSANAAFGHRTLWNVNTGNFNSAFGSSTMGLLTSGSGNLALGHASGIGITTGSNNITIGRNSDVPLGAADNQMSVGNVIYGSNMDTTTNGRIGIGVTNPGTRFQVGPDHLIPNVGGLVQVNLNDADTQIQGLKVSVKKTTGDNFAVNGTAFGTGATTNYALYGYAANATGKNWGLYVDEGDGYIKGNVAIGTFTPNASAALDITSTTKGLLLPRMTKAQRTAIVGAVAGLMIYQTDAAPGLRVFNGTNWMRYTETID